MMEQQPKCKVCKQIVKFTVFYPDDSALLMIALGHIVSI